MIDVAWMLCGTPFTDRAYIAFSVLRKLQAMGAKVVSIHRSLVMLQYAQQMGLPAMAYSPDIPRAGLYVVGHFRVVGPYGPIWSTFPTKRRARVFHYDARIEANADFLRGFHFGVCVEPTWTERPDLGGLVVATKNPALIRDHDELEDPAPPPFNDLRSPHPGRHSQNSFGYRAFWECAAYGMTMGDGNEDATPNFARDRDWRRGKAAGRLRATPRAKTYENGATEAALALMGAVGG